MSETHTPSSQEPEIAEVGVIAQAEAERRKKGLMVVFAGLAFTAIVIGGLVMVGQDGGLGPVIEIEEGEKETLEETNDPQCRTFIADVTELGKRFKTDGAKAMDPVLSEDPAKVEAARAEIAKMRAELDTLRADARKANLRYQDSKKDLADFFSFVDTELRLLDLRAEYHLARIAAEAKGETYEEPEPKSKRKGKIIGKKRNEPVERADRNPEQKRDDAIVAIHVAFDKFRVWHSAENIHPCGAAEEGETPWTPAAAP